MMDVAITSIALDEDDERNIVITLADRFISEDMITITYAAPGILSNTGGSVAAVNDQMVTNNVPNLFVNPGFEIPVTIGLSNNDNIIAPLTWSDGTRPPSTAGTTVEVEYLQQLLVVSSLPLWLKRLVRIHLQILMLLELIL